MDSFSELLGARHARLYDSAIQDMIELVHSSGALSFTAGEPSIDLMPEQDLRKALFKAFENARELMGYYHDSSGLVELRDWIAEWTKNEGLLPRHLNWENILLTTGSQEGLSLFTEAVIDQGDVVAVENPSYPEAFLAFAKEGASIETVPIDDEGPSTEALENLASRGHVKFFYTIPCFQNPSGSVTSLERRKEILELAKHYNFLVLEDDPYRNLWFEEAPPTSYISLHENDGRVIYLGSFSKVVAPGIRCGWIAAPEWIFKTLHRLRVATTLNLPAILHLGLLEFLQSGGFTGHLERLRKAYRARRDGLVEALHKHFNKSEFRFEIPKGGFFLWGEAPGLKDSDSFVKFAIQNEGVGVIAGKTFSPYPAKANEGTIRLSFAKVSPEEADEGCERLKRALSKYMNLTQEGEKTNE